MAAQIWSICSGKGGVGKTFVTSSLGITLSKLNHSVLLIDFDLTGANLHSSLGLPLSERNLRHYFEGHNKLGELVQGTTIPRVSYIQGFWDSWSANEVSSETVDKLIADCRGLNYDYIIFDLGAGPNFCHLDLLQKSDERLIIANSEPTTVEKTYRLIEAFICHTLKENSTPETLQKLVGTLRSYRQRHPRGHFSFRKYLHEATGFDFDHFEGLETKPFRIIVNSARSRLDHDLGYSIRSVANKYYDFPIDYIGSIDFDNAVWQAIRNREPVLIEKPFTPIAGQFLTMAKTLTNPNFHASSYKAVV